MASRMPHSSAMSLFKRVNYFKKLPDDLTISTAHGSVLTIIGAVAMMMLFVLELRAFTTVKIDTVIEVDDTVDTMMRINFNVTIDDSPCDYVSVDLTDVTGTYEHNITRHITKVRLSRWRRWIALHPDEGAGMPAYIKPSDEELEQIANERAGKAAKVAAATAAGDVAALAELDAAKARDVHGNPVGEVVPLSQATLAAYVQTHDMVFVNFFAPWCHWCLELEPIWAQAAAKLPELHYGEHVKMASIDCVLHVDFCREMHIRAFPTLVLYSDHSMEQTQLYRSTRSLEAIHEFLEDNAKRHHVEHEQASAALARIASVSHKLEAEHGPEGCMIAGHLLAKKVPGTFHIKLHSPAYSHDSKLINASHVLHHLSFGGVPSREADEALGGGAIMDLGRSLAKGSAFVAESNGRTFVHFHKVVCRLREYLSGVQVGSYAYTMHSAQHEEKAPDSFPSIKFSYDLSPMKVVERESKMPFYHFVTSLCAIIGGFFTLLSFFESSVHYSLETVSKKLS